MGNFLVPIPVQTTYAFKDLVGALVHPLLGTLQLAGGNIGIGQINIRMLTVRTDHNVSADGVVMPSYEGGDNAEISIECQQTSLLHHRLLDLYNLLQTAAQAGIVGGWAQMVLSFRTILDGAGHICQGCSFQKIPDKAYASKGGNVTWVFLSAYTINQ